MRIKNGLVVGVILLFVGISIQPAIAVNPIPSDNEEDCNICPKVSKQHRILIKSLLNRLDKYENQLSVLYKLNPDIEEEYQGLSDKILMLKQLSQEIKQNPIFNNNVLICSFLFIIGIIAAYFWITNYQIIDVVSFFIDIEKHPFIAIFFYFNYLFWGLLMLKAASLMVDLECIQLPSSWYHSISPLKSIFTLTEINDIPNLIEG